MTPNITIGGVMLNEAQARAVIDTLRGSVYALCANPARLREVFAVIEAFEKIDANADQTERTSK